jgi:hypothetical protein
LSLPPGKMKRLVFSTRAVPAKQGQTLRDAPVWIEARTSPIRFFDTATFIKYALSVFLSISYNL